MSINACVADKPHGGPVTYRCTSHHPAGCAWGIPMPDKSRVCTMTRGGRCTEPRANRAALIVALEPGRDQFRDLTKMVDHTGDGNEMVGGSQP